MIDSPPRRIEVVFVNIPAISWCLMWLVTPITNSRNDLMVDTRSIADMLSMATRFGLKSSILALDEDEVVLEAVPTRGSGGDDAQAVGLGLGEVDPQTRRCGTAARGLSSASSRACSPARKPACMNQHHQGLAALRWRRRPG
ncbi:MAG: hypothetical protein R3F59_33630 [Myxococcota bacterium]